MTSSPEPSERPSPRSAEAAGEGRPRLVTGVFLLITLATFAFFTSVGILLPTLPLYAEGPLGGGSISVGLAVGAFSLSAVLVRPFVGRLGDARGRRILIVGGGAIVGLAVAGFSLTTTLGPLVALRLVNGVGEAMFYIGTASAINDLAPDERRGEAVSLFSLALYAGIAVGPVLGETILEGTGFIWVWLASGASAGVAGLLGIGVPDTRTHTDAPPVRRLVHPAGLGPGAVLATSIWGFASFNAFMALYAREVGLSGSRLVFVTFAVTVLLIRAFGARIPDIFGPVRTARAALASSATGLVLLAAIQSVVTLFVGTVFLGIGQALVFPALMTLAVDRAPASERGAAIGTFTAFFDLSFGFGALTLGAVASVVGLRGNYLVAAAIVVLGQVVLWRVAKGVPTHVRARPEVPPA